MGLILASMGVCTFHTKDLHPISVPTTNPLLNDSMSNYLHYSRTAPVHILVRDPVEQRVIVDIKLSLALTEPILAFSQQLAVGGRVLWASGCILPGQDPRGGEKVCQDMVVLESVRGVIFACEFDGHGPGGEAVVAHCRSFVTSYFFSHIDSAAKTPQEFLISCNEECDQSLNASVNCQSAGCTAVMMVYHKGEMHFSGVGDSRAMLATAAPPANVKVSQPARGDDKELLEGIKLRRSVTIGHTFAAVQMTQDQKPEDPAELQRIREAGGVVMRLEDERGRRVGPYRVWKVEGMYPGIAMSRSLGDAVAHEIGIISTPIISSHRETPEMDFFLVLASDGVWDVMENQEVCDFVEAYRHKAVRNCDSPNFRDPVQPDNVTIAQLLCEEARARWLLVVEAEDVNIDDISCVILELQTSGERKRRAPSRVVARPKETEDVPGLEKTVRHRTTHGADPKRDPVSPLLSPQVTVRELETSGDSKATINDPRRSSVSQFSLP